MLKTIIKNNLIVVVAYVSICFIFLMLRSLMMLLGVLDTSERGVGVGIFSLAAMVSCFLVGKLLLEDSQDVLTIVLSLSPLAILVAMILFTTQGDPQSFGGIIAIPIAPVSQTVTYFTGIQPRYTYLALSILPSSAMLLGMLYKTKR